jgi:predicted amidophosphoribosyltransferase
MTCPECDAEIELISCDCRCWRCGRLLEHRESQTWEDGEERYEPYLVVVDE